MKLPSDDPALASATYAAGVNPPRAQPLEGARTSDVVVVGAGITGLSTALHLAKRGREVTVLDSGAVAHGGSGRALGLVLPHHKLSAGELVARFGAKAGERLASGILAGPNLVKSLIEDHGIACDLTEGGWIMAAHTQSAEHRIHATVARWREQTEQVELLSQERIEEATGSRLYRCGLLDRRALGLNPYAYAAGLAQAAIGLGVTIHTHSRVLSLKERDRQWRPITATGEVQAPEIVIATDAYADHLIPAVRKAILPIRAYQLVTEPLPAPLAAAILPARSILTDTRRLYGGIRKTADGRLQISADGPPTDLSGHAFRTAGQHRIRALYLQLGEIRWADEWSGWVGMTRSHLPHVWHVQKGLTAAVGMNGRGIAMATLLGRDLSRRLTGARDEDCFMPIEAPRPWWAHGALHPAVAMTVQWYRLLDRMDTRGASQA